ncbi:hypothetical protein AD998_10905 [bacterium 336/3]|nr:hypothetical protein AD998_10905 [bacterium 336/3]
MLEKNHQITPWRVVAFVVYVSVFLGIYAGTNYYLTNQKILNKEGVLYFADSTYSLKIPNWLKNNREEKKEKQTDIRKIRQQFGKNAQNNTSSQEKANTTSLKSNTTDSLPSEKEADSIALQIRIQYPDESKQALANFFQTLQTLESNQSNELFRVFHYGDSQLEGDRMTSILRSQFQERFGGCGAGINGMNNNTNAKLSVKQENDSRWKTFSVFGNIIAPHNYFGALANFYQFADTAGYVIYKKSDRTHYKNQKIENIKILYRNPNAPVQLKIFEKENLIAQKELLPSRNFTIEQIETPNNFEEMKISFNSRKSPDIYGVALDCQKGITFDNIPIRGSAGLEFHKIESNHLQKQARDLKIRFVILQFGVNVGLNSSDYNFYENQFYKEIMYLKKAMPQASFLVIGTSDRSYKKENGYASYPGIIKLRDAQKRAAFRAGCAFWDLYEAMGGRNSMPTWVKEGLAGKDYTHFKIEGANLVGNMLYQALIKEYEAFKLVN